MLHNYKLYWYSITVDMYVYSVIVYLYKSVNVRIMFSFQCINQNQRPQTSRGTHTYVRACAIKHVN